MMGRYIQDDTIRGIYVLHVLLLKSIDVYTQVIILLIMTLKLVATRWMDR